MALKVTSEEVIHSPGAAWPGYLEKCLDVWLIVYQGVSRLTPYWAISAPLPQFPHGISQHLRPIPQQAVTPIPNRPRQHPDLTPMGCFNTLSYLSAKLNRVFRSYSSEVWDARIWSHGEDHT